MQKNHLFSVVIVSIVSLFLFWSPWLMHANSFWGINFGSHGMETIVQNFDGLNFLVVAKSLYDPTAISTINEQFKTGNSPIYFAAHYPAFAVVIRSFELVLPAPYALLSTIMLSNFVLAVGLYYFFTTVLKNQNLALWASMVALFLPARMLSVRAVGSNEPIFMFFVLVSLALSVRNKHWLASLMGCLAILTRSPGILLFAAYALSALVNKRFRDYLPYLLMPMTLLALFAFYGFRYGDFLAYFNSGDNLHLFFPPFQIFSNSASWVSGMWREDILYLYLFYGIGLGLYFKSKTKNLAISMFGLVYGVVILLVSHRDLARYALPLSPVALLGYAPFFKERWARIVLAILVIPTMLLGWQFVVANVQPISDWSPLLIK
ncbi:MAG: hypothetical protein WCL07_04290 [bacterium]